MLSMRSNLAAAAAAFAAAIILTACGGGDDSGGSMGATTSTTGMSYTATSLISDVNAASNPYASANVDANLVNAWGVAFNPQGFVWVANNGTSTSTLYDGNGVRQSLVVSIPAGTAGSAAPTGIVFNGTADFQVTKGGVSGAAPSSSSARPGRVGLVADRGPDQCHHGGRRRRRRRRSTRAWRSPARRRVAFSTRPTSTTAASTSSTPPSRRSMRAGAFTDPTLPAGYAPFGIQAIGGQIYVTYAKQDAQAEDDVAGAGLGVVRRIRHRTANCDAPRRQSAASSNAPWGMALAPADFGGFSNALLVGNFGDGRINAFDPATGSFLGTLSKSRRSGRSRSTACGASPSATASMPSRPIRSFFAAGPADESTGCTGASTTDDGPLGRSAATTSSTPRSRHAEFRRRASASPARPDANSRLMAGSGIAPTGEMTKSALSGAKSAICVSPATTEASRGQRLTPYWSGVRPWLGNSEAGKSIWNAAPEICAAPAGSVMAELETRSRPRSRPRRSS